ncbi:hypothetical protein J2X31_002429 [Flavobacterium arsenatis]|uniref:Dihydrolipoamide dehydrogenase n=1 Tax=Flavobacterium arsenatis TaxID=1484332 RepID=A0ABU1TQZ5_9FLAO|nr:hypothetical protein [Flavobacterium arsenatis]MDR6968406.1 hypothetical protein [Flavobacterium arsenatis]
MKRIFLLLAVVAMTVLQSCEGDQGPPGRDGLDGASVESEVFELQNVNFQLNQNEYMIRRDLNPAIFDSDNILIYRMTGTINPQTPIWQLIPRTLFLNEGELDYDFDFSRVDFTIYAGGTYNLATTPQFINNQTFRIVIVPGYFSRGGNAVNFEDYNAVIEAYGIDDSNIKILN